MVYEKGTFPVKNGIQKGLPPAPHKLWTVPPGSQPIFSEATQEERHEPFDFPNGINGVSYVNGKWPDPAQNNNK